MKVTLKNRFVMKQLNVRRRRTADAYPETPPLLPCGYLDFSLRVALDLVNPGRACSTWVGTARHTLLHGNPARLRKNQRYRSIGQVIHMSGMEDGNDGLPDLAWLHSDGGLYRAQASRRAPPG